ncbi:MAG: hypothetical protein WEB00_07105 [Dehalococcoidia bacterium]
MNSRLASFLLGIASIALGWVLFGDQGGAEADHYYDDGQMRHSSEIHGGGDEVDFCTRSYTPSVSTSVANSQIAHSLKLDNTAWDWHLSGGGLVFMRNQASCVPYDLDDPLTPIDSANIIKDDIRCPGAEACVLDSRYVCNHTGSLCHRKFARIQFETSFFLVDDPTPNYHLKTTSTGTS